MRGNSCTLCFSCRFELVAFLHGEGRSFYYACDADGSDYTADLIAGRGIIRCSTEHDKVLDEATGEPLRASEKPVALLQYLIVSLVREFDGMIGHDVPCATGFYFCVHL